MALPQDEIDRIREEELARYDIQEELRRENARQSRTLNAVGWLLLLLVLIVLAQKLPELEREQMERERFRQALDAIVNR